MSAPPARPAGGPAWPLGLLLAVVTLDEGGSAPTGLLLWHGLLVLLLLREIWTPGRGHEVAPGARVAFSVYAAVLLAGAIRAPYGFAAWLEVLEVAAVAGIAWLSARRGPEVLARLAPALLAVTAAQGALVLVERVALASTRPAGSFQNANHFAAWSVAVLLLVWAARAISERPSARRDAVTATLSAVTLAAVTVSASRGALVGLVAGAGAAIGLAWPHLGRRVRSAALGAGAVVLIVVAAGVAVRQSSSDPFRYQRLKIWRAAAGIAIAHPLTGTGPGQLRDAARAFQFPDGHGPLRFDRGFATTHSDPLRVAGELGLPGLAAAAAIAAALALVVARKRSTRTLTPGELGAAAALAALGTQALVDNLSSRSALYALAAVLAGGVVSVPGKARSALGTSARLALAVTLAVTFTVGDVAPFLAWRATRALPRGRLSEAQTASLDRALERNPIHPDTWRRRSEHLAGETERFSVESYARAREAAETAVRLDPNAAEHRLGVARVEALACRSLFAGDAATTDRARHAYAEVQRIDPYNATHALEAAESLADCGDAGGAAAAARRALDLEPEAATPRLVLASALVRSDGARAAAEAENLVEEATSKAAEWEWWASTGSYARRLLALDPERVARVRAEISAARSSP